MDNQAHGRGAKARPAKAAGTKTKVEIAVPALGQKTPVSIGCKHGFVRCFFLTSAATDHRAQPPGLFDPANPASEV
ncbi:hypothetical protein [Methylobacterium thuringiense]|uniref:hypothetical protein n=1 Tax=Methylobacterium thuringiense TaxID=1003091 RepID=UPI001EDFF8B1|nr:hypothetical protein [Methylobacterium thuringiense]